MELSSIIFAVLLLVTGVLFGLRIKKIRRNINLGKDLDRSDNRSERWKTMARVAIGQSKMTVRPIAGILHILVYIGFVLINIEVLEIVIDGVFGTHRALSFLGGFYDFMIGSFEILAFLVLVACVIFLIRRNVMRIQRFHSKEMTSWPKSDANLILVAEILLMFALLSMNACDQILVDLNAMHYTAHGSFPISQFLVGFYDNFEPIMVYKLERFFWWFHIIGIFAFAVYVTYSKHFHIFLAFPNTFYSNLDPKGGLTNMEAVMNEVKMMMDPNADPYAAPDPNAPAPERFGAKDVQDLTWKQLMDSYTCTECGRCTSVCPANVTGKKLSPRKIMMDTRDRLDEVGKVIDVNKGTFVDDGKSLLNDYISEEELWACTSCNACVDACPVLIDPLSIIIDMRRYLIMEESKSPETITGMFNNIENNGAPWAFPAMDRDLWKNDL